MQNLQRAFSIYSKWGFRGLIAWGSALYGKRREAHAYERFMQRELPANLQAMTLPELSLISVILPVYNVDEKWLRKCLDSVLGQSYKNWELCIADDASTAVHIRPLLEEYSARDTRIKVVFRETNGHISAASNSALELATGEFSVLLDHDDELSVDALFWVANEINEHPEVAMIYSDEDLIDENGRRSEPKFKPDLSRDLLYSLNLVTHLSAYRTSLLKEIDGFRVGLEGSQDYDLALRVIEKIDEKQIRHIPRILYHWRAIPGSVALDGDEKPYAHERARHALREHFERTHVKATVEETHFNLHRVHYELPETPPKLSVICWSDNSNSQVSSFDTAKPDYAVNALEIIKADSSLGLARSLNEAVASASGDIIVFLRNDLVRISDSPLTELASFALQPSIGCVGGIVFGNNGTVEAGGIVFGGDSIANVAHANLPEHMPGNMVRNLLIGNFSAVCLDVFAMRREVFLEVGSFDEFISEKDLLAADRCLRVGNIGLRTVLTPYAKFACPRSHDPNKRNASIEERNYFLSKWSKVVEKDPFSNPNLFGDGRFSIKH